MSHWVADRAESKDIESRKSVLKRKREDLEAEWDRLDNGDYGNTVRQQSISKQLDDINKEMKTLNEEG